MRVLAAFGAAIGQPFATDLHQPAGLASVLQAASKPRSGDGRLGQKNAVLLSHRSEL